MSLFCFIGSLMKTISRKTLISIALFVIQPCMADDDMLQQLQSQAEQFVLSHMNIDEPNKVEAQAASIDSRRPIHACDGHLTFSLAGSATIKRNTSVKISCNLEPAWEFYLPVRVRILKPFVTVNEAISKDTRLTADMLKIDMMDSVMMRGDTYSDISALVGSRSKRDLRPGQPVRQSQVCMICREDTVQIEAATSAISIKTEGRAMQDGNMGETIRVENSRSKKIINSTVVGVGQVKVKL